MCDCIRSCSYSSVTSFSISTLSMIYRHDAVGSDGSMQLSRHSLAAIVHYARQYGLNTVQSKHDCTAANECFEVHAVYHIPEESQTRSGTSAC